MMEEIVSKFEIPATAICLEMRYLIQHNLLLHKTNRKIVCIRLWELNTRKHIKYF